MATATTGTWAAEEDGSHTLRTRKGAVLARVYLSGYTQRWCFTINHPDGSRGSFATYADADTAMSVAAQLVAIK